VLERPLPLELLIREPKSSLQIGQSPARTSNECLDEMATACNADDTELYINTFHTKPGVHVSQHCSRS